MKLAVKNIKLTVKNKLTFGFGAVIFLMVIISINTHFGIEKTSIIEERLLHLRFPTVLAGAQLENGINQSLAGLRGYMILGKNPEKAKAMKEARLTGWKNIDDAMKQLHIFSAEWNNPEDTKKLKEMEVYINEFRVAQQEVEDISHTIDEIPALKTLLIQAAPRANTILAALSAIIDEEANLKATTNRKKLLKLLADSQSTFAISLANIRAYLISGDDQFRDNFDAKWKINQIRFKQVSRMTNLMTDTQRKAWNSYKKTRTEFAELPPLMFEQRSSESWNLANAWLSSKAAPKAKEIFKILHEMRINQEKQAELDNTLFKKVSLTMEWEMVIGTILGLIIAVVVAVFIGRSINVPLQRAVKRAQEIARGDLTGADIEITGNDELTELTNSINEMKTNLHGIIMQVSTSANDLSAASDQLQSAAVKTNKGMDNQRSETEQVATAMNEMSCTVQEVAQNAGLASKATSDADAAASNGLTLVSQNMDNINQLAQRIENASQTINKLGEDTNSVDSIVAVITQIAEQTNLLALNAAIEAARAGEQGRGFAVVADEVRTLASRTQESTEEIRSMLDRLKSGASAAVVVMNESQEQAKTSVDRAKNVNDTINEITRAVASINDMNNQIATAAEEQSAVADEMNRSVVKISTEAETTLENTLETSSAATHINQLSSTLQGLVSRFKVA